MRRLLVIERINVGLLVGAGLSCLACADEALDDEAGADAQLRSLDDDLELHWTFEDRIGTQITDVSGNGRHGTLLGGSFVDSPLGQAVSLDGVDDQISITHLGLRDPSLYGGVDGDFTISARVRVADVDKLNTLCFGCGPFASMFVGTASGPKVQSSVYNQTGGSLWPTSSAVLVDDMWREVTMVVEGGVAARYYLDCELDTELQNSNIGLANYNFSAVGSGSSADRWYGGEIDRLRVWSRALSEPELAELCPEPPPLEQGLELHWTFEARDGNQITDVSGNGRHGTLHGGSFVSSPNGDAVALDGTDDYVAVTHLGLRATSLYGGVDGDFTISARVQVADVDKLNSLCFGCGPFSSMYIGTATSGPKVLSGLFNQQTNGSLWPISSAALTNDEWREVTMVVDGGTVASYYFDCELDTQLQNSNIGLKDYNFSGVGLDANPDRWFGGQIDDLRIWNRALSEQELADLCADEGEGEGDLATSFALFPVKNAATNEYALYSMRLDVADPLSTLDLLLHGQWREFEYSRSDGRFVAITGPDGKRYVDFAQDPPVVHEFPIPGDLFVVVPVLLEDSSGWIVNARDDVQDRDLLWRLPIEPDGSPGVAELLTPLSAPGNRFLLDRGWDVSDDLSTLAVPGYLPSDPTAYRMYTVDLLDPSSSPTVLGALYQDQHFVTPNALHLTPDGGELIFHQAYQTGLAPTDVWWFDIDGASGPQLIGQAARTTRWESDGRTALYQRDASPRHFQLQVGESSATLNPINPPGTESMVLSMNDGAQLMIRTDQQSGTVYMGDALGPYTPVLGGAAGEDPVSSAGMAPDERHVIANYRLPDNSYDVMLLEIVDQVVIDADPIVLGSPTSTAWALFEDHAVIRFSSIQQLWLLEYADPDGFTALTPVLPAAASNLSQRYSAGGDYLLRSDNTDKNYYLIPTAAPGTIEVVDMAPYKPWRSAVVSPY